MTDFVIDASVALTWCFDDEASAATRAVLDMLETAHAAVPPLWPLELANALVLSEGRGRITSARAREFVSLILELPIRVDAESSGRALGAIADLARREGLTAYDASDLELALRRGLALATRDAALAAAAQRRGVPLLPTA